MTPGKAAPKARSATMIAAIVTALTVGLWGLGGFDAWELKTWDWRTRTLAEKGQASDEICLIMVDQQSLDWGKTEFGWAWPWPREVFARLIEHGARREVKALALDLLFLEPSVYGVEDDQLLGQAVAAHGKTACALFLGEKSGSESRWPEYAAPGFQLNGVEAWLRHRADAGGEYRRATFPVPEVAAAARVLSHVGQNADPDGIYRRIRLFSRFDGQTLPALALGAFYAAHPNLRASLDRDQFRFGEKTAPLTADGRVILRYRGPSGTHRSYSAAQVLRAEMEILAGNPAAAADTVGLTGKYVLLGFSAPGLMDLRPSPFGGAYPGTEIHATLLDNFLSQDFMQELPGLAVILLLAVFALAGSASAFLFAGALALMIYALLILALPLGLSLAAFHAGYMMPLIACEAAAIMGILASLTFNYATEGKQKRFIKAAFKQYLSPAVIEQLIHHPERLQLGGERRTLSIFFSDLKGFTSISEGLAPEELTALLNDYLTAMTDIIMEEDGTVDKYEGDAIIAFWNAPLDVPDHAHKCVRAALRCQQRLAELRPVFFARIGKELHMRIGVNTGPAVVGNFGSNMKFDYTMLGDAVNLAARLEGTGKEFGLFSLISAFTRQEIGDEFAYREVGRIVVVGRREAVTIFEPMFPEEYQRRQPQLEIFATGLGHFYQRQVEDAAACFARIATVDPAAEAYLNKCRSLSREDLAQFDGTWILTQK